MSKAKPSPPKLTEPTETGPRYTNVEAHRPEGYDGTCLRPLGLCELGGCCDGCWYNPDHPRFRDRQSGPATTNGSQDSGQEPK